MLVGGCTVFVCCLRSTLFRCADTERSGSGALAITQTFSWVLMGASAAFTDLSQPDDLLTLAGLMMRYSEPSICLISDSWWLMFDSSTILSYTAQNCFLVGGSAVLTCARRLKSPSRSWNETSGCSAQLIKPPVLRCAKFRLIHFPETYSCFSFCYFSFCFGCCCHCWCCLFCIYVVDYSLLFSMLWSEFGLSSKAKLGIEFVLIPLHHSGDNSILNNRTRVKDFGVPGQVLVDSHKGLWAKQFGNSLKEVSTLQDSKQFWPGISPPLQVVRKATLLRFPPARCSALRNLRATDKEMQHVKGRD